MPHITHQHRCQHRQPNTLLFRKTKNNSFNDGEECVKRSDVDEHHAEKGRDWYAWSRGGGKGEVGWQWQGAGQEAVRVEGAEIGASDGRHGLEVEEPDSVDEGDAVDEGGLWGHDDAG